MIFLYTIGCPACNVLEKKLQQKNIEYVSINDLDVFKVKNIDSFPMLQVEDKLMSYANAVKWVNSQEA